MLTVGIDIGGTSVRAAVVDGTGRVVASARGLTPDTVTATDDVIVGLVDELRARHDVSAVGLAVAGFVSRDRRRVMFAPHLAWRDDDVPDRLAGRLGVPVVMDHDVNSAAWAEYLLGAAAGSPVALLVAIGTGIGAGLVVDGALYRGAFGVAPELGHLVLVPGGRPCPCGKRGCWERYCSGTALATTAVQRWADAGVRPPGDLDDDQVTGSVVARAAADGDPVAVAAVADLADLLAAGLAMAADVLDPELIVIGGGVSASADLFLPAVREALPGLVTGRGHRPLARLEVARLGDRAGMIGAALLAGAAAG